MAKKNKAGLESTAYHEAGHALVADRFNHYGGIITIVQKGHELGSSKSEGEWRDGSKDIEQIIVLYAGFAAESKYDPGANILQSSNDNEKAAILLLKRTNETELNLRKKAREMIDKDWHIIEAIAEKLLIHKTLKEEEWSIIITAFDEGEDWEKCFNNMRAIIRNKEKG